MEEGFNMKRLLRLFLLRLGLFVSCIGMVVSFFWAYPYQVIVWNKTVEESFRDSALNYLLTMVFLVLTVGLLCLVDDDEREKERKDVLPIEKPKEQSQSVEEDRSVVY